MPTLRCNESESPIIITLYCNVKIISIRASIKLIPFDFDEDQPSLDNIFTAPVWPRLSEIALFDPSSPYILFPLSNQAYMVHRDHGEYLTIIELQRTVASMYMQEARLYGHYVYSKYFKYHYDATGWNVTSIDTLSAYMTDSTDLGHVVIVNGKEVCIYVQRPLGLRLLAFAPDLKICSITEDDCRYLSHVKMEIIDNTFIWSINGRIFLGKDLILQNQGSCSLQDVVGNYFSLEHEHGISIYFVKNKTLYPLHDFENLEHASLIGYPDDEKSAFVLNHTTGHHILIEEGNPHLDTAKRNLQVVYLSSPT